MAVVKIIPKVYEDTETGRRVDYERLAIIGVINDEIQTLEIKLQPTELMLAKLLLGSKDNVPETNTRHANKEERDEFDKNITKTNETSDDWLSGE